MKTFRATSGPFAERPHFELYEIERICTEELHSVELFPTRPEPVRIERFVEKRFGVTPTYDEMPQGVLGFTRFGAKGVESIVVSRALADDNGRVADRRLNTTIAHEAGHGLLHAHLFIFNEHVPSLFDGDSDVEALRILCREGKEDGGASGQRRRASYGGRWWEWQANRCMGALLLPKQLVSAALHDLTEEHGRLGGVLLPTSKKDHAASVLAEVFDVNPVVARLRLSELYPEADRSLLSL